MNWLKKALPHFIAIIIFLIVSVFFCKPVLDGRVLNQHDTGISGWKGSAQNSYDIKEKTGKMPLWNTNVFSGMPNYQIAMEGKSALPFDLNQVFGLGLPKPMNFFFIACICFYILSLALGFNPVIGILGGLTFAFSTYNPLIISSGHETKMMAIAYMPLLLAGLLLIFNRKYWLGIAVATLGAYMELMSNHPQISYYFFIVALAVTIGYMVNWIRQKDYRHLALSLGLSAVAALVALGCYSLAYLTTSEYTKFTMRGGKDLEISATEVKAAQTSGLDADYAFNYSMKPAEPLIMLMPKGAGGSSGTPIPEDSEVVEKLVSAGVPEMQAAQFISQMRLPLYWGGMSKPGEYSGGPAYIGALIFILAIIGFVVVRHRLKWPLLIVTVLSVLMSWGSYFYGFNHFLLNNLPLYNKFRAPSMALVIAEFTMPLMALLAVYTLFFKEGAREALAANFKKVLYTLGGIAVVLGLVYLSQDYSSGFDQQILQMQLDPNGGDQFNRAIIAGMKADRQHVFGGQVFRALIFLFLVLALLYGYLKKWFSAVMAVALITLISLIDLWIVDKQYFPDELYIPKDELQSSLTTPLPIDQEILKDKDPHYRVYEVQGMNDNRVSYYHRSVLGYHPAKLRNYQDIIEKYFSGTPNEQILNALDAKYIINVNQQGQQELIPNPSAYGAAWFVKAVKPVKSAVDEIQAIGQTNLKDTAVVQQSLLKNASNLIADSSSVIQLVNYGNDLIEYTTSSAKEAFAVFSEVYYPAGWNAYIDGQKTEIIKTDYFLRGLVIPAGKHTVKMVFEPESVKNGIAISYASSWLLIIIFIGGCFMHFRIVNKKEPKPAKEEAEN
ncbi:YfhO family protein [Niabella terrae]